jgi:hypothetical protein
MIRREIDNNVRATVALDARERRRVRGLFTAMVVASVLAPHTASHAQPAPGVMRGRVVERTSQLGIAGAIVTVLDGRDSVLARVPASESGTFAVIAAPGAQSLRVVRIGFSPVSIALVGTERAAEFRIEMTRVATLLGSVRVRANSDCRATTSRAQAYALFEQIRYALLASIVSSETNSSSTTSLIRYTRYLDGTRELEGTQEVRLDTLRLPPQPFGTVRTLRQYADSGFVKAEGDDRVFLAPDATVLFAEEFPATFCLDLARAPTTRLHQVGVRFARPKRPAARIDIEGEIWIDTLARALRDLEFRYVGLTPAERALRPGGRVEFVTLANGQVIVPRWSLRLAAVRPDSLRVRGGYSPVTRFEAQEIGGEVASMQLDDGTRWHNALGSLAITVQREAGNAAPPHLIGLQHTNYQSRSLDSTTVVFEQLLPGRYRVEVRDAELAKIGLALETDVTADISRDMRTERAVRLPTVRDYAGAVCKAEPMGPTIERVDGAAQTKAFIPRPRGGWVALLVLVTDPRGRPLPQAIVHEKVLVRPTLPAFESNMYGGRVDRSGRYLSCWQYGVDETVQLWVTVPGMAPQLTVLRLDKKVVAAHLVVPDA